MNDWKKYKLKDIVEENRGVSYGIVQPGKTAENGVPILKVNNLIEKNFSKKNLYKVELEVERKYIRTRLRGGEVLLSIVGSLGETFFVNNELVGINVVRAIAVIPVKKIYSPKWVYWWLKSPTTQRLINNLATTSVQPTLNLKELREIYIPFPPQSIRESIINILDALDDKIELNLQMNKTLEEMAMSLYKHWFVDFGPFRGGEFMKSELGLIPEGWEVKPIGDLSQLKYGKALKEVDRIPGDFPVYGSSGIVGSHIESLINGPSVIIGRKGNVGATYWENNPSYPIDTVFYLNELSIEILRFLYLTFKRLDFSGRNSDSAVPGLNRNIAHSEKIIFPGKSTLLRFERIASSLFNQVFHNIEENLTLIKTRDYLLPKLISGEIEVKTAESTIKEVL